MASKDAGTVAGGPRPVSVPHFPNVSPSSSFPKSAKLQVNSQFLFCRGREVTLSLTDGLSIMQLKELEK